MAPIRTLVGISVFWLGLSVLGDAFTGIVLAQRVAALAEPAALASALGLIASVGLLAGMLVQPVAGAVSDALRPRIGRGGQVLAGAILVVPALAAFAVAGDLASLAIAFVLVQVAASVAQAAQQGYLPDQVGQRWRGRAAGLKGLADLGGAFIGFLVLGLLLTGGEATPAVVATGLLLVGTAIAAVLLVREHRGQRGGGLRHEGWSPPNAFVPPIGSLDVHRRSAFLRIVGGRFLFLLGTFVVGRFLLLFVAERLGVPPAAAGDETGALLAALTLIGAVAAVPTGWLADRIGRVATMVAGGAASAGGAALLLGAGSLAEMLACGALMAIGSAAFAGANWAITADIAPPGASAGFYGLANVGTAGAAMAAGLLAPAMDLAGLPVAKVGIGSLVAFGSLLMAAAALAALTLRGGAVASIVIPEANEP